MNNKDTINKIIKDYENKKINWNDFKSSLLLMLDQDENKKTTTEEVKNFKSNSKEYYLNTKPLLEVVNLTKQYKGRKAPAINNISFNIYPGEFHAFVGANGSGKTTTIKSIIGAYSPKSLKGKILIQGQDNNLIEAKNIIGYIPEEAKFPKKMSLKTYLYLMCRLSGLNSQQAHEKTNFIIKDLNLESLRNKRPFDFSSGQKKRVLLAQALINNPQVLIMDEPAANLDPMARKDLFDELLRLKDQGKSIFISSHILDEIGKYATYCTILDGGNVVFSSNISKNDDLSQLYSDYVKKGSVDSGILVKKQN